MCCCHLFDIYLILSGWDKIYSKMFGWKICVIESKRGLSLHLKKYHIAFFSIETCLNTQMLMNFLFFDLIQLFQSLGDS